MNKEKLVKDIKSIIFFSVVSISILFVVFTIKNYVQSNEKEKIVIDKEVLENKNTELDRLKRNIEILKNNKSKLKKTDANVLVEDLEKLLDYTENYFVLRLNNDKKYSSLDFMILYLEDLSSLKYPAGITIDFLNAFNSYDKKDEYKSRAILSNMYREGNMSRDFIKYYRNKNQSYFSFESSNSLIPLISPYYDGDNKLSYYAEALLSTAIDRVKVYNLFIEDIMKAGGINE